MKVLKKGNGLSVSMDVTCPGCTAVLQIQPEDIRHWLGGIAPYSYTCPCCALTSYLHENELSTPMKFAVHSSPSSITFSFDEKVLDFLIK